MAGLAQRVVSGCGKIADPLEIIDFVRIFSCQLSGAVRGAGVHIDDLKGIVGERFQTFLNILFFVFSYDTYGNRNHVFHPRFCAGNARFLFRLERIGA